MASPAMTMLPPELSVESVDWLICVVQELCPAAAIGSVARLLGRPVELTCNGMKQSDATPAGTTNTNTHRPGYPATAPVYAGVMVWLPKSTWKFPAAVWSPEEPPVSLARSAPPPVPHSETTSKGCAGVLVNVPATGGDVDAVNRVRL